MSITRRKYNSYGERVTYNKTKIKVTMWKKIDKTEYYKIKKDLKLKPVSGGIMSNYGYFKEFGIKNMPYIRFELTENVELFYKWQD